MAGFADDSTAADFNILSPVIRRQEGRGEAVGKAERPDAREKRFQSQSRGGEAAVEADGQDRASVAQFLNAGGNPIQFFTRDAQGLFDEYVFAGPQRGDHEIRVKIVARGDEDGGR